MYWRINWSKDDVWRRKKRFAEHVGPQTDVRQGWEMIKNGGIINNEQWWQGNKPSFKVCLSAITVQLE